MNSDAVHEESTPRGRDGSTASPDEVAKFTRMADAWWDPNGVFKPLHRFNPERIRFIRDRLAAHFERDPRDPTPFQGLRLLDVGCGGGLIAEPMARMGFTVTGIDAGADNIATARLHANRVGLEIHYDTTTPEALLETGARFDAVLALEVVEHVTDVDAFLSATGHLVSARGALVAATLNRTAKAFLLAKVGAEYILRWLPPGTHDWRKFVRPSELASSLRRSGLTVAELAGMNYELATDSWRVGKDLDVNYMAFATRP